MVRKRLFFRIPFVDTRYGLRVVNFAHKLDRAPRIGEKRVEENLHWNPLMFRKINKRRISPRQLLMKRLSGACGQPEILASTFQHLA